MKNILGALTTTYGYYKLEDALEGISKAGFKYIEIASSPGILDHIIPIPENMKRLDYRKVLENCKNYGINIYAVAGHTRIERNAIDDFKKVIDFASIAGIKLVNTGTGDINGKKDENRFYSIMERLAEYAREKEVVICLEMHGSWCNTGKKGAKIIETIKHPNVKLTYDTANVIYYSNAKPEEDIKEAIPYLGNLHLKDHGTGKMKDYNFPQLGEGIINFDKVFNSLKDYSGPIGVEIELDGEKHSLDEVNNCVKKSYDFLGKYKLL